MAQSRDFKRLEAGTKITSAKMSGNILNRIKHTKISKKNSSIVRGYLKASMVNHDEKNHFYGDLSIIIDNINVSVPSRIPDVIC